AGRIEEGLDAGDQGQPGAGTSPLSDVLPQLPKPTDSLSVGFVVSTMLFFAWNLPVNIRSH
ncbi:MAG: hypothetical protein L0H70_09730, partial [Xanthomonadales bacterium]|nr:hypothetical protein [Xanthomonadales bacterium]